VDGKVGEQTSVLSFLVNDTVAIASQVMLSLPSFLGPGGVILFCYCLLLTRGLERICSEVALDGGSCPLVSSPDALCTTELMNLLLCGVSRGNVSAYEDDGRKVTWRVAGEVGLISRVEADTGCPLADELKGPKMPVYVVHGGDHFTLLWAPTSQEDRPSGEVEFVHWNGLPPNRGMERVVLHSCSLEPPLPAPAEHKPTHHRIQLGEIESIIQCNPDDKRARPGRWRTYHYEIALATQAIVDQDASEERPADAPKPVIYEQGPPPLKGHRWRCNSCYQSRFKTMCFGDNPEPAADKCKFCGLSNIEGGWTIWKHYSELHEKAQLAIDRDFGPKILSVLRTRWLNVEMSLYGCTGNLVHVGGDGFDPTQVIMPIP